MVLLAHTTFAVWVVMAILIQTIQGGEKDQAPTEGSCKTTKSLNLLKDEWSAAKSIFIANRQTLSDLSQCKLQISEDMSSINQHVQSIHEDLASVKLLQDSGVGQISALISGTLSSIYAAQEQTQQSSDELMHLFSTFSTSMTSSITGLTQELDMVKEGVSTFRNLASDMARHTADISAALASLGAGVQGLTHETKQLNNQSLVMMSVFQNHSSSISSLIEQMIGVGNQAQQALDTLIEAPLFVTLTNSPLYFSSYNSSFFRAILCGKLVQSDVLKVDHANCMGSNTTDKLVDLMLLSILETHMSGAENITMDKLIKYLPEITREPIDTPLLPFISVNVFITLTLGLIGASLALNMIILYCLMSSCSGAMV